MNAGGVPIGRDVGCAAWMLLSSNHGILVVGGTVGGRGRRSTAVFCMPGEMAARSNGSWRLARRCALICCWIEVERVRESIAFVALVTFVAGGIVDGGSDNSAFRLEYAVREGIARPLGSWRDASDTGSGGGAQ